MKPHSLLLLVLFMLAPLVRAQTAAPDAKESAQMANWFARGFYDDMVARADELTEDAQMPDPQWLYWRGLAFYRLGWLPEAREDLTAASDAGVNAQTGGLDVKTALDKIERLRVLTPPNYQEIKSNGQVVFRVHFGALDPVTRGIIARLPSAYRISRAMFGSDVLATSVYIFDNYPQFRAFYQERGGQPPGSWAAAAGSRDGFYFSLQRPDGTGAAERDPLHLESTIAHEFNHAMMARLMGTTPLPRWFEEGLAQVAGAQVVARDVEMNDYTIARLFAVKALIAPQKLEEFNSFGAHTELGVALGAQGAGIIAPSPYAQSFSMARYFLAKLRRGQLETFLNRVREEDDFGAAFQDEFSVSLAQFYQGWYQDTARSLKN